MHSGGFGNSSPPSKVHEDGNSQRSLCKIYPRMFKQGKKVKQRSVFHAHLATYKWSMLIYPMCISRTVEIVATVVLIILCFFFCTAGSQCFSRTHCRSHFLGSQRRSEWYTEQVREPLTSTLHLFSNPVFISTYCVCGPIRMYSLYTEGRNYQKTMRLCPVFTKLFFFFLDKFWFGLLTSVILNSWLCVCLYIILYI